MTVSYEGSFTFISDPGGVLGGATMFSGSHTFDLSLPTTTSDPNASFNSYFPPSMQSAFSLQVGDFALGRLNLDLADPTHNNWGINVQNDFMPGGTGDPRDVYKFSASDGGPTSAGVLINDIYGELTDLDGVMFSSRDLTEVFNLTTNVFDDSQFRIDLIAADGSAIFAQGNISTVRVEPIPAPGAAVLAIIGLPLVAWIKRRHG